MIYIIKYKYYSIDISFIDILHGMYMNVMVYSYGRSAMEYLQYTYYTWNIYNYKGVQQ